MKCPTCGADNKAGRRFCGSCGQPLSRRCTECGFENEPDDRFCGGCGAALAESADAPAAAPDQAEEERAERRQITVLFCDMVGSTALSQALDPEELRDLTRRYQEACTAVVRRYDGYVARYMGDGVLAYFGYPMAHEDDSERAVRAGLDMAPAMRRLNRAFQDRDLHIAVRVGIATGMVVAGDIVGEGEAREQTVVGETPNLAAKLQAAAAPDTVAIADSTHALIGEAFECEALPPVAIRGLEAPIAAWRVIDVRRIATRFEASRPVGLTPFVGREQEVALLVDRWRRACDGDGQVVAICGEPGIGKSRITGALLEAAAGAPHRRLHYQCSPYHLSSALHPVLEEIGNAAGFERADDDVQRLEKLEALFGRSNADPSRLTALVAPLMSIDTGDRCPPLGLDPERHIDLTLDSFISHVTGLAAREPVLIVFEDLHWSDPTSLELIDRLVSAVADTRILIVLTHRPHFDLPWVGEAHVTLLNLNRLGRRDCTDIVAGVTGGPLPDEVLDVIVSRTDGVPLFIEELTRAVLESGVLARRGDRWVLDGPLPQPAIPATLKDSLRARLDQLSSERDVCQTAAVIGRDFSFELLSAVSGRPADQLRAAVDKLVETSLVIRHGIGDRATYSFRHALIRDAAYESLLKSRRIQLHARVASVLRDRFADAVAAEPVLLAEHLSNGGMASEAADAWMAAGRQAASRAATREAIVHFHRCLEALAELPDHPETFHRTVQARIELARVLRIVGRYDDALAQLDAAEREAAERNDILALARVHHNRGNIYFPLGKIEDCLAQHQLSYRYAQQAGSREHEARALGGLGDAYYQRGRMLTAFDHFCRCIEISRKEGFVEIESANLHMVGWTRMFQIVVAAAIEDGLAAVALAKRIGDERSRLFGHTLVSHLFIDRNDIEAADRHAHEALALARKLGSKILEAQSLSVQAAVAERNGATADAAALARDAIALIRGTTMSFIGPRVLGLLAAWTPDPDERRQALTEAEALLAAGSVSHNHFWFRRSAMEQALDRQEWAEAERHADALDEYTAAEPLPWSDFYCLRARTLAAVGREERSPALSAMLRQLQEQATTAGLLSALPKIEAAMRSLAAD